MPWLEPTFRNRPLAEIELTEEERTVLGELAHIRTVCDFALLSLFPRHCTMLAEWLDAPLATIRAIAERSASLIPAEELRLLADKIRPTLRFPLGVHPPRAA